MEERELAKTDNLHLKGSLEIAARDLEKAKEDFHTMKERIRDILNIKIRGEDGHNQIFNALENVVDELKVRKNEVMHYKEQIKVC